MPGVLRISLLLHYYDFLIFLKAPQFICKGVFVPGYSDFYWCPDPRHVSKFKDPITNINYQEYVNESVPIGKCPDFLKPPGNVYPNEIGKELISLTLRD